MRPFGGALVALSVAAAPAYAQEAAPDSAAQAGEDRPFIEGGFGDRPYLSNLLGKAAIGGYAEAHARFEREDGVRSEFTFLAKRFNLFVNAQVSDFVRFGAELEIEEAGEEIALEFMTLDALIHPSLNLRAGMILVPLGRFNLAHDSPLNPFTDRPLVTTEILSVALSEPGLGFFGLLDLGGPARVTYQIYAVNGFDDGLLSADGVRLSQGSNNFEDNNNAPSVVGRVAWSPRLGRELGLSAHAGAYNVFEVDGERVDERRDLTIWALDGELDVGPVELSGEAALALIDIPPSLGGLLAEKQQGLYVDAVYPFWRGRIQHIPGSFFTARIRLDVLDLDADLDGDSVKQISLGVGFHPTRDTALKLDYVRGQGRDRFNNSSEFARVLFSFASYF